MTKVMYSKDQSGKTIGTLIILRDGKCEYVEQPNREAMIFFLMGKDGLPTAIQILEPAI